MANILFSKENLSLEVKESTSILKLALAKGIPMNHRCGAELKCASCKVRILEGMDGLSPKSTAEERMLEKFRFPDFIRLGCQAQIQPDYSGKIEIGTIIKQNSSKSGRAPKIPSSVLRRLEKMKDNP